MIPYAAVLTIGAITADPQTLHTAGVQMQIADDDNRDATVAVRYRAVGAPDFAQGPPLFRVFPETVTGRTVPEQFAGTIFDLQPGTTYEVELHAVDPDGLDETRMVMLSTRALPARPGSPRDVAVNDVVGLQAALAGAQAGDVITLADGTYAGSFFTLNASGTADQPIVLTAANPGRAILDGEGCTGCNILEVYGSYVHVERLRFTHGERALRFLGATTGNAVLRVTMDDVVHGVGSAAGQSSFTICDNVIHGRLQWPLIYSDDGAVHADDQGVRVDGPGHVVCHNDISGFGDPMINFAEGGRGYDFYGNDIHEIYADGTELDRGEGNVRCFGNRWTNVYTGVSIQPAYGGPTYVVRNVLFNVEDEQVKLKSVGGTIEPSGVLLYHNTIVSPELALNLQTPITQHNFVIANNLFVGPSPTESGRTVEWTAGIDRGIFDGNGYFPDEGFWFGTVAGTPRTYGSLAEAQADGVETNGRILSTPIFASGTTAPTDYTMTFPSPDLALDQGSNAIDVGLALPGFNGGHLGAGPDLGALESGCPAPFYGPRPEGMEGVTPAIDCRAGSPGMPDGGPPGDGGPGNDGGGGATGDGGGCGCRVGGRAASGGWLALLAIGAALTWPLARRARGRRSRRSDTPPRG